MPSTAATASSARRCARCSSTTCASTPTRRQRPRGALRARMTSTPRPETHRPPSWGEHEAEAHLRSLELFGMRFGLDRMRRMMTVLGSPQRRYESIQVLGTNGKTSTTRMIAAILERHGLRTAAYTSPHLVSYRERVQIGEREIDGDELAE